MAERYPRGGAMVDGPQLDILEVGEGPLDLTTRCSPKRCSRNLASGIPLYCVNLALVEGDQVTVAVVGNPSTGEIDVAERSRGAWTLRDGARRRLITSA